MINMTGEGYRIQHTETKVFFNIIKGAPCDWSKAQGAVYSLLLEKGGTRPAKLAKTRAYVGVDEDDNGNIVWEIWPIKIDYAHNEACARDTRVWYTRLWKGSGLKNLEALKDWKPV